MLALEYLTAYRLAFFGVLIGLKVMEREGHHQIQGSWLIAGFLLITLLRIGGMPPF
jgi:hypothetical protein